MPISSSPFTQGGQTQIHKLRMLRQVVISTLKIGLSSGVLGWMGYFLTTNVWINSFMIPAYGWALFMANLGELFPPLRNGCFFVLNGQIKACSATWFLTNDYCSAFMNHVFYHAIMGLYWGGGVFLFIGSLVVTYFLKKGTELHETQKLSGFDFSDLKGFKRFLKKHKIKSHLTLDNIPIPLESEVKHFMITGTTGSGKTNAIHHLLKELQDRGDKVVIVDTTGGYVSRFFDEQKDTLLNPLDHRSANWNLFLETEKPNDTLEMASFLVPKPSYQSEFWTQAARLMLSEGIQVTKKHSEIPSLKFLQSLLLKQDYAQVHKYFKNSTIASYFSGRSQETANSIRITLATSIHFLECLEEGGEFSIRHWIRDEDQPKSTQKGWLFLACDPEQRESMQGLLTCWFGLAIKAMMGLGENPNRRVWFIIDELASLHKVSSLQNSLAELRKYGGCMVLGFQNMYQLESIYGSNVTASLSELTGTKLIFQCVDPKVATRMADMLGQQEVLEASENISFGANEIRDGVSLSHQKKRINLVKPTELMQLKPLEVYVKSSLSAPIFKTGFSYLDLDQKNEGFVEKTQKEKTNDDAKETTTAGFIKELSLESTLQSEKPEFVLKL